MANKSKWYLQAAAALAAVAAVLSVDSSAQGLGEDCANPADYTLDAEELDAALARHQRWQSGAEGEEPVDLCNLNAPNADFSGMNLRGIIFKYAKLAGANFDGANLGAVNFHRADLEGASFQGALMRGTVIRKTVLNGANFASAKMRRAILRKSFADRANFDGATIVDSDLSKAFFEDASMRNATLTGSNLRKARLIRTDLSGSNLDGAALVQANLTGANLSGVDLSQADTEEAVFDGASMPDEDIDAGSVEETQVASAQTMSSVESETEPQAEQNAEPAVSEPEPTVTVVSASEPAAPALPDAGSMSDANVYRVQLGAFRGADEASQEWSQIQRNHGALFTGREAFTEYADLGGDSGVWYRLQVGPFDSQSSAAALCQAYQNARAGAGCFTVTAR